MISFFNSTKPVTKVGMVGIVLNFTKNKEKKLKRNKT